MSGFICPNILASFTTNGDSPSIGYFTVADVTGFVVGAIVSLRGTTAAAGTYQVADVNALTNTIGVRAVYPGTPKLNGINYGLTSISQYTTADTAQVYQTPQFIYTAYSQ